MRISSVKEREDTVNGVLEEMNQGELIKWTKERSTPVALVLLDDGLVDAWEYDEVRIEGHEVKGGFVFNKHAVENFTGLWEEFLKCVKDMAPGKEYTFTIKK